MHLIKIQKNLASKHERERKALLKIKKRFPTFKTLIKMLEGYEKRKDEESKFIYALDKIIPPIQIYLEKGALWNERKVSFDMIIENKKDKIILSKTINTYWEELLIELRKNRKKLFPN